MGQFEYSVPLSSVKPADIERIAVEYMKNKERESMKNLDNFRDIAVSYYDDALNVLVKKQADYGPKNIAHAPGGALNGLRVRMHDKMSRINNLVDNNATPENESLRDSFLDMLNYSVIAMMVLDGVWPNE
jgi:hypothetical protein